MADPNKDELWLTDNELARKNVLRGLSKSDPDLVADERNQLILDAIDGKDVARVGRLMNGSKK